MSTVSELQQRAELKAKVEAIGRDVDQLTSLVIPAIDDLKGKLASLKEAVHQFMIPEIAIECEEKNRKIAGLTRLLVESQSDLRHFVTAHGSEYAARRYRELTEALQKL